MPSRNIIKQYQGASLYHTYFRGLNKQPIFLDDADFTYFEHLLARYLSEKQQTSKTGVPYAHFYGRIELAAYCLLPNHVHFLLYQHNQRDITEFMKSLLGSYSQYFNLKYRRSGPLFESTYKAVLLSTDVHLGHISRYIHMNPRYWKRYPYSSLRFYFASDRPKWICPERTEMLFNNKQDYLEFLTDYQQRKDDLEEIKHELASL